MQFHRKATMIRSRAISLLQSVLLADIVHSDLMVHGRSYWTVNGWHYMCMGVQAQHFGGFFCENVCYKVHLMSSCHVISKCFFCITLKTLISSVIADMSFLSPPVCWSILSMRFVLVYLNGPRVCPQEEGQRRESLLPVLVTRLWLKKKSFQTDLSVIWFQCQSFLTPETRTRSSELVYYHFIRYGSNVVIDTSNPRSRSRFTFQAVHTHRIADPFTVAPFSRLMKTSQGLNTFDYLLWFLVNWFFYWQICQLMQRSFGCKSSTQAVV